MTESSFDVSIVPCGGGRVVTGPMTLAGLALLASTVIRLSGLDHAGISFCYFKALTGHACLSCGATRALGHLSRFDVPSALVIQPLVTAGTLGLMIWGALDALLFLASKRTVVRVEGRSLRLITLACVTLAVLNWMYLLATGV